MLTKKDKARIYINRNLKRLERKITNEDIEIRINIYTLNGELHDMIISTNYDFFPFPYTKVIDDYYISNRIDKLNKLNVKN